MDKITTDFLITLADLDEDRLYQLYTEAISKLRSKDISHQDRKIFTIRICYIRSLVSDKYGLRIKNNPSFNNPMSNEKVNRFFKWR